MTSPKRRLIKEIPASIETAQPISFFSSGCAVLDCVLGGGWAEDRIANIVGDKATGKTLLMIEAATNYLLKHPDRRVKYVEVESAFDLNYASAIGMPLDRVDFPEGIFSVEDFFQYGTQLLEANEPTYVIVDSLDALSSDAELNRGIDEGSYGSEKAKKMSEMFRRLNQQLSGSGTTIHFVSQIRDKLNVTFGKKYTRSGGRALDFYASQIIELAHIKHLTKKVDGKDRIIGDEAKVHCSKNKVGLPFRSCSLPILFSFGVDDDMASLNFLLNEEGVDITDIGLHKTIGHSINKLQSLPDEEYYALHNLLTKRVKEHWLKVEASLVRPRPKYPS